MKRLVTILVTALLMTAALCVSASAADYQSAAEDLSAIGMFRGTVNGGFELDRAPKRSEAAIMLVRLYGAEEEAAAAYQSGEISHPFKDVGPIASPYVAWLYTKGITKGATATTFNSNAACTDKNYVVFLLRALGYKDGTDITWDSPWTLTDRLGISNGAYNAKTKTFLRADAAALSASTLYAKKKGSDKTLLKDLLDNGAISGSTVVIWDYDAVAFQEDYASFLFYPVSGSPATFTSFKLDKVTVNGLSCQTLQVTTPEAVAAYLASIGHKAGGFGYVEITYDEEAAAKAATEYYTAANGKKYPLIAFTFTYTATEASGKQQKGTFTDYYYFDA